MSYEVVRTHLVRCRRLSEDNGEAFGSLVDALEQLTNAVESDLTQIKVALSYIARLKEHREND